MMAFESAGKRIGSLNVNLVRVALGALFLSVFCYVRRGLWLPVDATLHNWIALVPVLIIPPAVLIKKEIIGLRDVAGAAIAVAGSVLLFL